MTAQILDGKLVSNKIQNQVKDDLDKFYYLQQQLRSKLGQDFIREENISRPTLAVILCGNDPASELYVKRKQEACKKVGINSYVLKPFEGGIENWNNPESHLFSTINYLNEDKSIHGILLQLPLPEPLQKSKYRAFDLINPLKDVDVFNPINSGLLIQGRPRFLPCTPAGIQELLKHYEISVQGKKVCIISRSDVVGKPLHSMLIQNNEYANATVTLCHDYTPKNLLKNICLTSDIIVVAVGIPGFLTSDMITEKTVVIDVGINRVNNKVIGDVEPSVKEKASWISLVPGGVGLLTVAMLMKNTIQAWELQI